MIFSHRKKNKKICFLVLAKIERLPVKYDIEQTTVVVDSRNTFEEQDKKFSAKVSLSENTWHRVGPTFDAASNKALLLCRKANSELTASQRQV